MPHLGLNDFEQFREVVREVMAEAAELTPEKPPIPDGPDATKAAPRKRGRPAGPSKSLRP
jgi:hypothetical protein